MISQISDYKQADLLKLFNKIWRTEMSKMQEFKINGKLKKKYWKKTLEKLVSKSDQFQITKLAAASDMRFTKEKSGLNW